MIENTLFYIAAVLVVIGSLFTLIAAIGVLRLPDLYTRMHAASKAGTMGCGILVISVALVSFDGSVALRAAVGVLFLLLTAPISAHLLARAAYIAGYKPDQITVINEMDSAPANNSPRQ